MYLLCSHTSVSHVPSVCVYLFICLFSLLAAAAVYCRCIVTAHVSVFIQPLCRSLFVAINDDDDDDDVTMFRTREGRERPETTKYTHPSTAAVAHVTVTTDNYESELPESPTGRRLPPLPPETRGFSSSIEYGGDGSPMRRSLRNSSLSSPSSTPRVTFEDEVPVESRPSSLGDRGSVAPDDNRARESVADTGASDRRASSIAPNVDEAQRESKTSVDMSAPKTSTAGQEDAVAAGLRPSMESRSSFAESTTDADRISVAPNVDEAQRQSKTSVGKTAPKTSTAGQDNTDAAGRRSSTESRPSTAAADTSRKASRESISSVAESTPEAGRTSQSEAASTEPRPSTGSPRASTSDVEKRASTANVSANNPQFNVNRNAAEPQNAGNVFVRFYRRLFRKRREPTYDDAEAAAAVESTTPTIKNTNVSNARISPSDRPVGDPRTPGPSSSGAGADAPSTVRDSDRFVDQVDDDVDDDSEYDDDDDDDDDEAGTTETDDDDTNNEFTRLLRRRRQPLPDLSQLSRTSFQGRKLSGDAWSRRPFYYDKKSPARRRYDALGETSSD